MNIRVENMGTGSSPPFDFGHWVLRLIAFIIDSVILGIVAWIILSFALFSIIFSGSLYWLYIGYGYYFILSFILGILSLLYFVILEVWWSGTIGKRLLGLQVQMVNGSRITIDKAFIRNISKVFWLFLILDWLVAVVTPGADRRQKYSDRIAGTTVVQLSSISSRS